MLSNSGKEEPGIVLGRLDDVRKVR
uniref:Uncharacterized protein n=1 Tax=Anguilla anguilla TaxID=7936 RepID=A0A0E9VD94_ANGAN